jgi:acetyl-CoA synthetase
VSAESFVWQPDPVLVERANVTRLMRTLGVSTYRDLVDRAAVDPAWYWPAVLDDLDIAFEPPFDELCDTRAGAPWARWFVGGGINVAAHCVDRWAAARPTDAAVIAEREDGRVLQCDFDELRAAVDGLAGLLAERGVRCGDRVALILPMGRDAVAALFAVAKLGAVAVPMFTGFSAAAIAQRMDDAGARMIVSADASLRRGRVVPLTESAEAAARAVGGAELLIFDADADTGRAGHVHWDALVRRGREAPLDPAATHAESPLMINYTSGTTGAPKGAVHVHGGLLAKVAAEAAYLTDLGREDRALWITDLGWLMGPWLLIGAFAAGACVVLYEGAPDQPDRDRLWRVCAQHRVTMLGVSPTLVRAVRGATEPALAHDLSALRILASTGEAWDDASYRWLLGAVGGGRCPIVNITGGTEVGACFLGQPPVLPAKACSVGLPVPGMAVDVLGLDGRPTGGDLGELVCRRPWPAQTRGFWRNRRRYLDAYWSRWDDVWVHGDWASVDADGWWFLHGRSDDTMNVAGKRIGPAEIEDAVLALPEVAECAAIGVPDELKGTAVWCFCVLADGADPPHPELQARVQAAVGSAVGKAFGGVRVHVADALPKTRSGKVVRRAIRARALGEDPGDLSSLESVAALDAVDRALGRG